MLYLFLYIINFILNALQIGRIVIFIIFVYYLLSRYNSLFDSLFELPEAILGRVNDNLNEQNINDHALIRFEFIPVIQRLPFMMQIPVDADAEPQHNGVDVHDHKVQSGVKASYKCLLSKYPASIQPEHTLETIKTLKSGLFTGESKLTPHQAELAWNTLTVIQKVNGAVGDLSLTESQCLSLVWSRINDKVNQAQRAQMTSSLYEQLADASITEDQPYCLIGRITRILQSLDGLDVETVVNLRSLDTIREEISNKIGVLRREFLTAHPESELHYTNGNREVTDQIKQFVLQSLFNEYRKTKILSKEEFSHIVPNLLEYL